MTEMSFILTPNIGKKLMTSTMIDDVAFSTSDLEMNHLFNQIRKLGAKKKCNGLNDFRICARPGYRPNLINLQNDDDSDGGYDNFLILTTTKKKTFNYNFYSHELYLPTIKTDT